MCCIKTLIKASKNKLFTTFDEILIFHCFNQNITKFRGVWPILTTWDRFGPFYGRFGSYILDILIYIIEKVNSSWFQCILIPEIYFLNQIVTSFDHIRQFQISVLDYFRPFLGRLESLVIYSNSSHLITPYLQLSKPKIYPGGVKVLWKFFFWIKI